MMRLACFMLCFISVACGDSAKVEGSLAGADFRQGEAIFAVFGAALNANISADTSGQIGVLVLSSTPGLCAAAAQNNLHASTVLTSVLLTNVPEDRGLQFDTGSYALESQSTIAAQLTATAPRPQRLGFGEIQAFDDVCQEQTGSPYTITAGTLEVTRLDAHRSMMFTFDMTDNANERLTGSMTAAYCTALEAIFGDATSSSTSPSGGLCLAP